jgi:hypothetical protein
MQTKPFEKNLYDKYDNQAKQSLISVLEQNGHDIVNVKENFYADVVSTKDGKEFYSEAEIKAAWKGTWPETWEDLRIPGRKSRLLNKYDEVTFFVFRDDCKQCFVVNSEQLSEDRLKKAFGPKIRQGEMFFHIPVNEVTLIEFKNNKWNEVK